MSDKENVEQKKGLSPKEALHLSIIISIFLTLLFGGLLFDFCFEFLNLNWIISLILTSIYIICHPYIGKGFLLVARVVSKSIDSTFKLTDEDSWTISSPNIALLFASSWPISGIPYILICSIGALFGKIFKKQFLNK